MGDYYDMSNLLSTNATYLFPYGQRSNGKSYQARKYVLENVKKGELFVYLRRWKDDIKAKEVERWFDRRQVQNILGKDKEIICLHNSIFLCHRDEKGNVIKEKPIGYYLALNEHERYKSWVFDENTSTIVFEEVITDGTYLDEEPRQLHHLISTISRMKTVKVILIGNTISRLCPYFTDWSLDGVLRQKQGTIEVYHQHVEDGIIDIAVENCNVVKYKNTLFFGNSQKQIISGEWDTYDMPKKPKSDFDIVYEVLVDYKKFKFVMQLMVDDEGDMITFVYRHTKDRHIDRVITDKFSKSRLINNKLNIDYRPEELIQWCFNNNKICYSDNLTGTDFKHVRDEFRF